MFTFYEDFSVFDDNKMPYSLEVERHTEIANLHARVEEDCFALHSIGNRFVFKSPKASEFSFKMLFGFTVMHVYNPNFTFMFHYDKFKREGKGLRITYDLSGKFIVALVSVSKLNITEIETVQLEDCIMKEGDRVELFLNASGGKLNGSIMQKEFCFDLPSGYGNFAIERKNYIGSCLIYNYTLNIYDEIERTNLGEKISVSIPTLNGGDIPYRLSWELYKEGDVCFAEVELSGGTTARKLNREDRPGQYVVEIDTLDKPYISFKREDTEEKFYIFGKSVTLVDPNIFWECLKEYWKCPEFPVTRKFAISESVIGEDTLISYGYEFFGANGYSTQKGGPTEFVFDRQGNLLYQGDKLTETVYELCSPEDKKILSLLPEIEFKKENVLEHIKNNHYFLCDEEISFSLLVRTKLNPEHFSVSVYIKDVYDREIISEPIAKKEVRTWKFGYNEISFSILNKALPEKLYRVVFEVFYGDKVLHTHNRVFEVLDPSSKITPAIASGLPYVFSIANEQKWLSTDSFDLWSPAKSCDIEHFISAVTSTPIEAEERKIWKLIPPFKREWFAWLQSRTCRNWQMENHMDVAKNCDYLYYPAPLELYPLRNDLYLLQTYTYNPEMRDILREFLRVHPEIEKQLSFKLTGEDDAERKEMLGVETEVDDSDGFNFTYENLKEFLDLCYPLWADFVLGKILELYRMQNKELIKINPKFKRSAYGPYNQYVNATVSYHTIRSFGLIPDESLAEDVYTGFAVFETYPYSCSYPTYRGVYGLMTTILHVPKLVMYPEQYQSNNTRGGCIDGAVKFANAPMGATNYSPYEITTSSLEFVFNTPQRIKGGYRYWETYGYHRPKHGFEQWDKFVHDWKNVIDFKPKKPLKTIGFIAEYTDYEDVLDIEINTLHHTGSLSNRSEHGHGVFYDCSRECGLNAGFAMKFETLCELSAEECDILFLPTLKYANEKMTKEIRRLHNEGVALVAVSDVTGLEDIFGVKKKPVKKYVTSLTDGKTIETIYPGEAEFYYESNGANVLLEADGNPALMVYGRNILLNASVNDVGCESFEGSAAKAKKNVSELLKSTIKKCLRKVAQPLAMGEDVGITLFESQKGERILMLIDYTPFDNRLHEKRTASVKLFMDDVTGADSEAEITKLCNKDGVLEELRVEILPHEMIFIRLHTD